VGVLPKLFVGVGGCTDLSLQILDFSSECCDNL